MSHKGSLSALVMNGDPVYTGFLIYWGYIILLSPAMPIALYITLVQSQTLLSLRQGYKMEILLFVCVCPQV